MSENHAGLLGRQAVDILTKAIPGMLPKIAIYREANLQKDGQEITIFFRLRAGEESRKYRMDMFVPSELLEASYGLGINAEYFLMGMAFERLRSGDFVSATEPVKND